MDDAGLLGDHVPGPGKNEVSSGESTQAYNRKWVEWIRSLAEAGTLESGLPLEPVAKDTVTDRPLQVKDVNGYLLVNAASLEEVVDIVRQAPHTELAARRSSGRASTRR